MKRKKLYVGTNTKMFKTPSEAEQHIKRLLELTRDIPEAEIHRFIIPSYTSLHIAKPAGENVIQIGAQNMGWEERGQFTGEISPLMLQELGIDLVMIGHSERRHILHEQLKIGLHQVTREQAESKLWIAYEPVWAIGVNGVPANPDYVEEIHSHIKKVLVELFGEEVSENIPVLYGGSVNNENATKLIIKPSVDGLFIGRSAWDADNFNKIIRDVMPLFKEKYNC